MLLTCGRTTTGWVCCWLGLRGRLRRRLLVSGGCLASCWRRLSVRRRFRLSINWLADAEPSPAILVLPPAAVSLDEAHAAIKLWEHYKRRSLDASQRLVVEVMMATRADGLWAAPTTGREMPRQNGKGDEIEVVELWGLVQRSERILHTIHDAVLLATESQSRLLSVIDGHPDLRRLKLRAWRGTGQQMIEMRNGGIIWYRTRTGGGARGVDEVDRIVIDEAQHAEEEHLAAVTPTLLASANPQLNALGSAGIAGKSVWWWRQRRRALGDTPGDFGYVGHTAESLRLDADKKIHRSPVDVRDRDTWRRANPALQRRPDLVSFLEEQLSRLGDDLFAREHLGVWDPESNEDRPDAKLPADKWAATGISTAQALAQFPTDLAFAFDVSHDSRWSSIAVASGTLQAPYVEVINHDPDVGWLPARLTELAGKNPELTFWCKGGGAAAAQIGSILAAFKDAGVSADRLALMSEPLYKQACGGFYTDVVEGRLMRPADGQGPLDVAAANAPERLIGDGWVWDLRSATVPICPLIACTIARALLPTSGSLTFAY